MGPIDEKFSRQRREKREDIPHRINCIKKYQRQKESRDSLGKGEESRVKDLLEAL